MRRSIWVVMLAVVLALAAACGGSSSSSSSTNAGASSSTPSSSSGGGGLSDSAFCASAKKAFPALRKQFSSLAAQAGSGPSGLKSLVQEEQRVMQDFVAVAPSDIKPSLNVIYGQLNKLFGILAKHKYNIMAAEPELAKVNLDSSAMKQAEAKLKAWGKTTCHLNTG